MKTLRPILVLALMLALGACGGSSGNPPPGEIGQPPVNPPPDPPPPPPDPDPPPVDPGDVGLDGRPANPGCVAPPRPVGTSSVTVQRVFPALTFQQPLFISQAPGDASRWIVLEKTGRARSFEDLAGVSTTSLFLDLSGVVNTSSEGGLLGLAFAPDWATSRVAYVSYTRNRPGGGMQSVVSRFSSADGGLTLDPGSEQVLLTINQPFNNHNGGGIEFGADGFLYLGMGDGGSGGDPQDNAQNTQNLLGTFLRIDVSADTGYAIPDDNPFAGNPTCGTSVDAGTGSAPCPEIFAWGLRNPWRFSIDPATGKLWAGDVGQNAREEINVIERGGNYGWRFREGFLCFDPSTNCPSAGLIDPVIDYPHSEGRSVTGGYVYRGEALAALRGRYVFGDFISGRIWALRTNQDGGYEKIQLADTSLNIASFGVGPDGEILVVDYAGGLYQLRPSGADAAETVPDELAETGCVDPADPAQPAAGLIPYQPNAPYWSDGAIMERWLAVPDDEFIALGSGGEFEFPPGSVLMQHFRRAGELVETRLLMHHPDGIWGGYTYAWNAEQSGARRVRGGSVELRAGVPWLYPSEAQCMQCHTATAGRALGLEVGQLNTELRYPSTGRTANQLTTLDGIELLSPRLAADPADLPALADPFGDAELGERARAYLHTNCAGCHRPGGPTPSSMDLRYDTPLAQAAICNVPGTTGSDLGVSDARLVAPGDPGRSLVLLRMDRRDVHAMPQFGSLEVDAAGIALLSAWIAGLARCD